MLGTYFSVSSTKLIARPSQTQGKSEAIVGRDVDVRGFVHLALCGHRRDKLAFGAAELQGPATVG